MPPAPKVDLTGWWRFTVAIKSSSFKPYRGLDVDYKIYLLQDGTKVTGKGEKWCEAGKELPFAQHDPIEMDGTLAGSQCRLAYVLKGRERPTTGSFTFDILPSANEHRGRFSGTGADVSGSLLLTRWPDKQEPNKAPEATR